MVNYLLVFFFHEIITHHIILLFYKSAMHTLQNIIMCYIDRIHKLVLAGLSLLSSFVLIFLKKKSESIREPENAVSSPTWNVGLP